ncbi:sugar ABC transporter substrate-binding protein [Paenibacillus abyssi]|uniref:Sugar ABC transporter substrate-binding protein n=1 Tax=Paenibacillus abyssi TaxID=1340531 RepID=A0A917G879_9BACL|nr:sugar ABC transporter substrate-binding protein [Paenibacillus abyssi]
MTINFFDWTDEQPYMNQVVSAFEEKHPNIKVNQNYVPTSDYIQKILVNLSTGGGDMDVFATQSTSNLAEYISKDVLEPLDDIAGSEALAGNKDTIEQLRFNDHIYGFPYRTSKWVLYYNKDLFDQAGIPYPDNSWTWDRYAEVAQQLSSGSGQDRMYGSMSYQSNNTWWRVLANIQGVNNPLVPEELETFKKAAEYYYNLTYTHGAQQPFGELVGDAGSDFSSRFLQGKTAMMWNGDWAVQMLNDEIQNNGVELNYDIAPLPKWEGSETTTTGSFAVIMVNKQSKQMDAAKKFAEFVASEEAAKIFVRNGLLSPWGTEEVKEAFLDSVTTPESVGVFSDPYVVMSQVPMDPLYNQGIKIVEEETSLYFLQEQSLDEAFQKIKDRIAKEVK